MHLSSRALSFSVGSGVWRRGGGSCSICSRQPAAAGGVPVNTRQQAVRLEVITSVILGQAELVAHTQVTRPDIMAVVCQSPKHINTNDYICMYVCMYTLICIDPSVNLLHCKRVSIYTCACELLTCRNKRREHNDHGHDHEKCQRHNTNNLLGKYHCVVGTNYYTERSTCSSLSWMGSYSLLLLTGLYI